jgi:hypothetical protein
MGPVRMRQLILSMGLVWAEVYILAQRATTPSKKISVYSYYHMLTKCCYMCCKNACTIDLFSPLQIKNKSSDALQMGIFFGLTALL